MTEALTRLSSPEPDVLWSNAEGIEGDLAAEQFLIDNRLEDALGKFVRFNTADSENPWSRKKAKEGYGLMVPLYDSAGVVQSLTLLNTGAVAVRELSLQGYETDGLAIGHVLDAPRGDVAVAFAADSFDALVLMLAGVATLAAPSPGRLRTLATFAGSVNRRVCFVARQTEEDEKTQKAFEALEHGLRKGKAFVYRLPISEAHGSLLGMCAAEGAEAVLKMCQATEVSPEQTTDRHAPPILVPLQGSVITSLSGSYASLCHTMRTPSLRDALFWKGELEFNEQILKPTIGRVPVEDHRLAAFRERAELQLRDDRHQPIEFGRSDIELAIMQVARERSFHPVQEYLSALSWDGHPRIAHVLGEILHIGEATALQHAVIRRWFISAVARALQPGCKVDNVLILTGPQGFWKSRFFRTLASSEWFTDRAPDIANKDSTLIMRRVWILEWAELDAMKRASSREATKAFITSQVDMIRPPYGRTVEDFPRTCVIVGTTNEEQFLGDPTGDRRYWPIPITKHINFMVLEEWRNQLWAEAVAAFKAGEPWYLTPQEEAQLQGLQQDFKERDVWTGDVLRWGESQWRKEKASFTDFVGFSASQFLGEAIGMTKEKMGRGPEMRIAAILTDAGWTRKRARAGADQRTRLWSPPQAQTEIEEVAK